MLLTFLLEYASWAAGVDHFYTVIYSYKYVSVYGS